MSIGEEIKKARLSKSYSQDKLAEAIGHTNNSLISQYENGKVKPTLNVITNICKALNIELNDLLNNIDLTDNIINANNVKQLDKKIGRENLIIVPLKVQGGFANGYDDVLVSLERRYYPEIQGECYAFEVEGFSMYVSKVIDGRLFQLGYKPSSYVYTIKIESFKYLNKNKNYVFQTVDGMILKTFINIVNDMCYLESINKEYNPVKPIHLKDIKGIYMVERYDNKEN